MTNLTIKTTSKAEDLLDYVTDSLDDILAILEKSRVDKINIDNHD